MTTIVHLGPMSIDDLPAIGRIEALAIPKPWPLSTYRRDLEREFDGGYIVARLTDTAPYDGHGAHGAVVGFAGWCTQHDEAHVTIIAVDPDYRRRRIAQRLLLALIAQAVERGVTVVTLEVRVSNLAAFCLYQRFGFREVGRRRNYYEDTGEDGLIMTTPPLAVPEWRARIARLSEALERSASTGR